MKEATIYTDGASSGNPGDAGIGVLIFFNARMYEISRYIGKTTNNEAEYQSLISALRKAQELKADSIEVFMDSQLVVRQVKGIYKVKKKHLQKLFEEAKSLLNSFENYKIKHISRDNNKRADSLAKAAIKNRAD